MDLREALILGLVQGVTEFLPVSSSGHLVAGQAILGLRLPGVLFEVAVHLATLVSVVIVYWRRIFALVAGALRREGRALRYLGLLALATLPAVVVGFFFRAPLQALFERPVVTGWALLVTGALLWSSKRARNGVEREPPGTRDALLMGVAQAFAIVPGISRSGATVVAGLWSGVKAEEAATFSFLMAIPAIAGAVVLQIGEAREALPELTTGALLVGGASAGVTGVFAIRLFVRLLERETFHRFALYCWSAGLLLLGHLAFR